MGVAVFFIVISIIVMVHEFGHYLCARFFKIAVLEFSFGFGPKVFSFKGKVNIWSLRLLPFGGYVKFVETPKSKFVFSTQHAYKKILVAFAGPFANILFAFIMYYILAIVGVKELKPIVASVFTPYANVKAQIHSNDHIINIANTKVYSWQQANTVFNKFLKNHNSITMNIEDSNHQLKIVNLDLLLVKQHYNQQIFLETLGIYPCVYLNIIEYVEPNSVAMHAGLKINDKIIKINNQNINDWFTVAEIIRQSPNKNLQLLIKRGNLLINKQITPQLVINDNAVYGKLGIMPAIDHRLIEKNSALHYYNAIDAFKYAWLTVQEIFTMNIKYLYNMLFGNISLSNLGGPLAIASAGKTAFNMGSKIFIEFLALISIGVGILNLLPLPILDGGQIVVYLIELFRKKPLPLMAEQLIYKIGFFLIIAISIFAIYNDILRF